MIRLVMLLIFLLPLHVMAQQVRQLPGFDPSRKVDGSFGYNSDRVAELPQGAGRLQLWVVLSPNFRQPGFEHEYKLAQWFTGGRANARGEPRSADPRLRQLQEGCAWNYYFSTNPLFVKSGLIQAVGTATPIVCLTAPDGKILATGDGGTYMNANTIMGLRSAGELADLLYASVERLNPPPLVQGQTEGTPLVRESVLGQCPDGTCPSPSPLNTPAPPPRVEGTLQEVKPHRSSSLLPAAIVAGMLAFTFLGLAAVGVFTPGVAKQ